MDNKDFKALIEELKKQGSKDQELQNKTKEALEEIADQISKEKETGDKDEDEKLDEILETLKNITASVTGIKENIKADPNAPLIEINKEISSVLSKSLEELTILRKVSEGSLEYDKESAQYRNTSGRELESVVSGKDIKKGGYIDFESAADRLTGQGKRVRESDRNKIYQAELDKPLTKEPSLSSSSEPSNAPLGSTIKRRFKSSPKPFPVDESSIQNLEISQKDKTIREKLKEEVAATKQVFGSIGKGISSAFTKGKDILTKPKESLGSGLSSIKEVLSTPSTYSVEKERFGKEFDKQREEARSKLPKKDPSELQNIDYGLGKQSDGGFITPGQKYDTHSGESLEQAKKSGAEIFTDIKKKGEEPSPENKKISKLVSSFLGTSDGKGGPISPVSSISTDKNEENDNFVSAQEVLADNSKTDLELTKEILTVQKEQLVELKKLSEAFVSKVPPELKETKPSVQKAADGEGEGRGLGLSDVADLIPGKKTLGKLGRGAAKAGKGLLKFAGSRAGMIGGAALAVGTGAYTAYKGITGAEEEKKAQLEELDAKVQAGEITPEEAEQQKTAIGQATVEKKGEAAGEGTGMAAGGVVGMKAGAALGATVGSVIPGVGTVVGAGVGALAGGALGAFTGSKVGKKLGSLGGELLNKVTGKPEDKKANADARKSSGVVVNEDGTPIDVTGLTRDTQLQQASEAFNEVTPSVEKAISVAEEPEKVKQDPLAAAMASAGAQAIQLPKNENTKLPEPNLQPVVDSLKLPEPSGQPIMASMVKAAYQAPSVETKIQPLVEDSKKQSSAESSKAQAIAKPFAETFKRDDEAIKRETERQAKIEKSRQKADTEKQMKADTEGIELAEQAIRDLQEDWEEEKSKETDPVKKKEIGDKYKKLIAVKQSEVSNLKKKVEQQKSSLETTVPTVEKASATASTTATVTPSESASVEPTAMAKTEGAELSQESVDNKDLSREANKPTVPPPVVSSNVSNNTKNTFNPSKPTPRMEYSGSALDRYQNRIAVF